MAQSKQDYVLSTGSNAESERARAQRLQAAINNIAVTFVAGVRSEVLCAEVDALIKQCSSQDYAQLPHICDQRSGRNLAGLVTEVMGHGWGGRYNSMFRKLVRKGFDTSVRQKDGTTPNLMALQNDAHNLHEDDLTWAFKHGLDPLAHYTDMAEGRSILSVDFGPRGDVFELFVINTIKRRLKALEPSQQGSTLDMLVATARDEWQPALAKIKKTMLEQGLEQEPRSKGARTPRKL